SVAMQVLATSDGSATSLPSMRPPPCVLVRQPPPWPQPPSSCCWLTRYASPFLTVSLRALGLTGVAAAAALGSSFFGSSFCGSLPVAQGGVRRARPVPAAQRRPRRSLFCLRIGSSLPKRDGRPPIGQCNRRRRRAAQQVCNGPPGQARRDGGAPTDTTNAKG